MKQKKILIAFLCIGSLVACKKDYFNPNQPTDAEVFSQPEALTRVIVGIKNRFAVSALSPVYQSIAAASLSTKEAVVQNAGNADLATLESGGNNLAPNNGVITNLWAGCNLVGSESQKVINGAAAVGDPNLRNSILAYGHLYKALALGTLATFWERVPIENGQNAVFSSRTDALLRAVKLLDDASSLLSSTTITPAFTASVGSDIDLPNALPAIAARYYLMLGDYDKAIARAAAVNLTKKSAFFYNTTNVNPIFRSALTQNNVFGIKPNFGLTGSLLPNPADKRIAFHLTKNGANGSGFFLGDLTQIPLYLPGEMILIQAEANARKTLLPAAKTFLDQVLTKLPSADAFGVGADLPAYSGALTQGALLDEIYRNRCIELYFSGLKLEDSRRFGRPNPTLPVPAATAERTRNFYPYPQQERDGNPVNTPADPAI
jgi:starch-binding outer membrane protein, SusD/RagB family